MMISAVCRWLLLLCSLSVLGVRAGGGGKYSRDKNENRAEGVEFRIQKLNQVWEKAQRLQLSPVKLAELHSDVRIQEKDELNWKKLKAEGLDDDGEKEAKLRRSLSVILAKYGLDGKKQAQTEDSNYMKDGTGNDVLNDPRLEKMWNKAKTSGKFSEEELDNLWREFLHHKEKTNEYNILLDTVTRMEEVHKNVISPDEHELKTDFLHSKHGDLKEKLHSINHGYERLRKLSHEGYAGGRDFTEPRVNDLWDMAKSANFSDNELESFKEELKHFETKVEKHQHYQKQLEISHEKLKHVVENGDKEHIKKSKEKHNALTEKIKEMGYKVKKHLQDLSSRISKSGLSHNEL
ncbi:PREDICTED: alpha-2-macroglobulin receptor-associated protein [Nanorana parkeri]|uniref:alpha-2-macroglobulin receptor-associated protein n=1 Tax=Nanorana parkeri TaxID=125878 RepID=UPI000854CAED|nr:PREDICTED: alpha-2-macroglobulin receptor-associated protein [Nanorana parkeri]